LDKRKQVNSLELKGNGEINRSKPKKPSTMWWRHVLLVTPALTSAIERIDCRGENKLSNGVPFDNYVQLLAIF
jgi:hypothetical protein